MSCTHDQAFELQDVHEYGAQRSPPGQAIDFQDVELPQCYLHTDGRRLSIGSRQVVAQSGGQHKHVLLIKQLKQEASVRLMRHRASSMLT